MKTKTEAIDVNVCPAQFDANEFFERSAIIEYDHLIPLSIPNYDYMKPRHHYPSLVAIRERAYVMAKEELNAIRDKKNEQMNMYVSKLLQAGGK